jgi:hypothetical protein
MDLLTERLSSSLDASHIAELAEAVRVLAAALSGLRKLQQP